MNRPWTTRSTLRAVAVLALASGITRASVATTAADPAPVAGGRVVILGFDGADARTVRELVERDPSRYPNFRKLIEQGTFAPLEVVVPAESPVSWASLNSGQNPAKTGVPGFIRRHIRGTSASAGFGHIEKGSVPLETFDGTPLPNWSASTLAAVAGGGAFVAVLLVALLLFRKLPLAATLGVLLGGGAAWAGWQAHGYLPASYPRTSNVNQVDSFWDHAARAGVPCVVLDAQQAFDGPNTPGAKVLYGLGLPDARGGLGDWSIYTTDPAQFEREGKTTTTAGTIYRVDEYDGKIQGRIKGPDNFWLVERLSQQREEIQKELATPGLSLEKSSQLSKRDGELKSQLDQAKKEGTSMQLEVRLDGERAHVRIGEEEQTIALGQWSEFYDLTFDLNWLLKVHAITRVRLVKVQPYFELLVNVLDIDPRQPPFWQAVSSPPDFATELAHDCGLFETYGWPTLTMPFKDKKIEPEVLLEDVEFTERWRENLTHNRLDRDDWRCLMSVFSTTDRVQHMTYQFYDPEHPLYAPEVAARETEFFGERIRLSDAIPAIYRQMDRIIGDVEAKLRPDDTLFVISDHGFQTFRRQVHLNNWLAENGYLAIKPGLSKSNKENLGFVDWKNTKAYALGLGFIYLNLEGREPQGIVARDDARALIDELKAKLLAATDPETGERFCTEVYVPRDIHEGQHLALEADVIPGFRPPYRVGWSTSGGGLYAQDQQGVWVPGPICTNNDSNWSGDHVSMALPEVAGVFFSNRKVKIPPEGVRALQIAPTALTLLGVTVPPEMDLPPLEFE